MKNKNPFYDSEVGGRIKSPPRVRDGVEMTPAKKRDKKRQPRIELVEDPFYDPDDYDYGDPDE
jgi:hypothetical protein